MMRLPWFGFQSPKSVAEAARILANEGPQAMLIAGGTDLVPNMKRRQQTPATLVSLRRVEGLKKIANGSELTLGAGLTLSQLINTPPVREKYRALWQAAAQVATPHLRNMGTLGGNLCLDTRCTYYNQNYEWRKAIDFCLKKDGKTCWVATRNKRCVAVSSTDTAPALIALGAKVRLVSVSGEREISLADLYKDDGKDYLARKPDEILTEVLLPAAESWRSTYWKLRRRGSFDFPLLGVAAAVRTAVDGTIEEARVVFGAMSSRPLVTKVGKFLVGKRLTDDVISEAIYELFPRLREPRTNPGKQLSLGEQQMLAIGRDLYWRKDVAGAFLGYALCEIRGDDMGETRLRIARQAL